jgi:hypothetical protein
MQFVFEATDGFAPANADPGSFVSVKIDPETLQLSVAVGHEFTGQSANDLLPLIAEAAAARRLVPRGASRLALPQICALLQSFYEQQRMPDRAGAGRARARLAVI